MADLAVLAETLIAGNRDKVAELVKSFGRGYRPERNS